MRPEDTRARVLPWKLREPPASSSLGWLDPLLRQDPSTDPSLGELWLRPYLRNHPVQGDYELHFFGPRVDEAKPLALERRVGALFGFELVARSLDLLFASENCGDGTLEHWARLL